MNQPCYTADNGHEPIVSRRIARAAGQAAKKAKRLQAAQGCTECCALVWQAQKGSEALGQTMQSRALLRVVYGQNCAKPRMAVHLVGRGPQRVGDLATDVSEAVVCEQVAGRATQ